MREVPYIFLIFYGMELQFSLPESRRLHLRFFFFFFLTCFFLCEVGSVTGLEILSKSKLERCIKLSDDEKLDCNKKIVLNMAVPSGSSGGEASIIAELVEVVEENNTQEMQTIRAPPVITINKSSAYALYELEYIRDVSYKPEEFAVRTRKCEPDASAKVVKICARLSDQNGHIIEHTRPICCPCGPAVRRSPSSCGNIFDKLMKGKANTAHCLRFPGDWFQIYGIGRRSLGFSIRIQVRKGSIVSDVVVGPENRTVLSTDNFLRVNLIGDFVGYTNIPSFEDFYLVIPRQAAASDFSKWMLLERVRFTLDGLECNKIGVSYEAFNGQPNFCSVESGSCLHHQLWNYWEGDQTRLSHNKSPQYVVEGRFERINQHPNAGTHSFSIGITEVLNTNLLIELSADDIEYVSQRSPGMILSINIPTFEALTQFGTATVITKNIGKLEASYSLTFNCLKGVSLMEEQFFIMKPEEVASRSFKLYPTRDQAAKYECAAVLKASDFSEVDRAECQFITTATILDNGSQITPAHGPSKSGFNGFLESVESIWNSMWNGLVDFLTGKSCRSRCTNFFNFSCQIQYICLSWIVMFGLLLAIFPTAIVLLWLLHQKGFFDYVYDWWDERFEAGKEGNRVYSKHGRDNRQSHLHRREGDHYHSHLKNKGYQKNAHNKHRVSGAHRAYHKHSHSQSVEGRDHHYFQHTEKNIHKHHSLNPKGGPEIMGNRDKLKNYRSEHRIYRTEREAMKGSPYMTRYSEEKQHRHKQQSRGRLLE